MDLREAINLIKPAISNTAGNWADIGAGTGVFTEALFEILESGDIIAVDKNTHSLYKLFDDEWLRRNKKPGIEFEILEADFHNPVLLPPLDGIVMANALHYAKDHAVVLKNVLGSLKTNGTFILIEYDTEKPNKPWVPNPVSFLKFQLLCKEVGLQEPVVINRKKSIYGDGEMYVAKSTKV